MKSADELARSYDWCYRVARGSGSSFYRAFWLLDKPQRNAMFALYAFARITDDLSDDMSGSFLMSGPAASASASSDPSSLARRAAQLSRWQTLLENRISAATLQTPRPSATSDGEDSTDANLAQYDPLWPALRHTVKTYRVPTQLLDDLIAGVSMDLKPVRLEHWSDVDRYCYHVASTIGLACTTIWQAADSLPVQQAIDCGLAFQLTNILRDVREDAARNRIYLPLDELKKFGCDTESWLAGAPRGRWLDLISSAVERAKALYADGARTIDHLPPRSARMFALMWTSYRELLSSVDRQKEKLWQDRRVRVTRGQRLRLLLKTFATPANSERLWRDR